MIDSTDEVLIPSDRELQFLQEGLEMQEVTEERKFSISEVCNMLEVLAGTDIYPTKSTIQKALVDAVLPLLTNVRCTNYMYARTDEAVRRMFMDKLLIRFEEIAMTSDWADPDLCLVRNLSTS
jgi:hypothetical protein